VVPGVGAGLAVFVGTGRVCVGLVFRGIGCIPHGYGISQCLQGVQRAACFPIYSISGVMLIIVNDTCILCLQSCRHKVCYATLQVMPSASRLYVRALAVCLDGVPVSAVGLICAPQFWPSITSDRVGLPKASQFRVAQEEEGIIPTPPPLSMSLFNFFQISP